MESIYMLFVEDGNGGNCHATKYIILFINPCN